MTCHSVSLFVLLRKTAWTHLTFSSLVDMDGRSNHSVCYTYDTFLNLSIYSNTLPYCRVLFPYCAESLMSFCCSYNLSPQKSDHCTVFLWCIQQVEWPHQHFYNNATTIIQGQNHTVVIKCVYIYTC
jgi:hypothetical protein